MKKTIILISTLIITGSGIAAAPVPQPIVWQALHEPSCGGWENALAVSPHDRSRIVVGGDILGIGLSLDGGDSWRGAYGLRCFGIGDFTWHPTDSNIVWAGTLGGPYQSTNGGRDWISRRTGMPPVTSWIWSVPIQKILFDPNNSARLLAFGGYHRGEGNPAQEYGNVYESTNSGSNWRRLGTVQDGGDIQEAAFGAGSSTVVYAAVKDYGVCVSQDGGATWQLRTNGLPSGRAKDLAVHPTNLLVAYVAMNNRLISVNPNVYEAGGIWMTSNGGTNWVPRNNGLPYRTGTDGDRVPRFESVAISRVNPNRLVTSDTCWYLQYVYVSDNGGESWRRCSGNSIVMPSGMNMTGVEFDPADADTIFVFGSEYVLRSRDGGYIWEDISSMVVPGLPGFRGRGYAGWVINRFVWHPTDPQRSLFAGLDNGFGYQSRNGLRTWTRGVRGQLRPWSGSYDACWGPNDSIYMTHGQFGHETNGIYRSLDGGEMWTRLQGPGRGLPTTNTPKSIYARPDVPGEVWVCWHGLRHSTDYGENWSIVPAGTNPRCIAADPNDPRRIFVACTDGVYQCTNGTTFSHMTNSPVEGTELTVDTRGRVFAMNWRASIGGLYRFSSNRWSIIRGDRYSRDVAVDPRNPRRLMLVTCDDPYHDETFAAGVWTSEDDGRNWRQQNVGLPTLGVICVSVSPHDPDLWVVGTGGRGLFITRWADLSIQWEVATGPPQWRVLGTPNLEVHLEHSTDLINWHPIATNSLPVEGWLFGPGFDAHDFFRAKGTW